MARPEGGHLLSDPHACAGWKNAPPANPNCSTLTQEDGTMYDALEGLGTLALPPAGWASKLDAGLLNNLGACVCVGGEGGEGRKKGEGGRGEK